MNPLTYNNPERAKERAEVVPPTDLEMAYIVQTINHFVPKELIQTRGDIQRLLDDYENKLHFYNLNKGWQGEVNYEIVKP